MRYKEIMAECVPLYHYTLYPIPLYLNSNIILNVPYNNEKDNKIYTDYTKNLKK